MTTNIAHSGGVPVTAENCADGLIAPLIISELQIAGLGMGAGFAAEALHVFVAIVLAESGGNIFAAGRNTDGSIDRGLAQINNKAHPDVSDAQAFDSAQNAKAAYAISSGGTNWRPWSTFNNRSYLKFYSEPAVVSAVQNATATTTSAATGATAQGGSSVAFAGSSLVASGPLITTTAGQRLDGLRSDYAAILKPTNIHFTPSPLPLDGVIGAISSDSAVNLSSLKIGEVSIVIDDPGLSLFRYFKPDILDIGHVIDLSNLNSIKQVVIEVDFYDLKLVLSTFQVQQGPAGEQFVLYCREAAAEKMKLIRAMNPQGADVLGPDATTTFKGFAAEVGADFVGQAVSSSAPPVIRNLEGVAISPLDVESNYDIGDSYAQQVGYWWFVSENTVFFAQPSEIAKQVVAFNVGWRGAWGDGHDGWDALEVPECRYSSDTYPPYRLATVKLPPERGQQVRPGMLMRLKGVSSLYDTNFDGSNPTGCDYLVTDVSFNLDGGVTPVTVETREPVDPIPTDDGLKQQFFGPSTPTGATNGNPPTGTGQATDFVRIAQSQLGKPYLLGAHPSSSVSNPTQFDCSGLVGWAAGQVGVDFTGASGPMYQAIVAAGLTCDSETARTTVGALFFTGPGGDEHVGISLGNGRTIEAVGGGGISSVVNLRWGDDGGPMLFGRIPGMTYPGTSPVTGPATNATQPSSAPTTGAQSPDTPTLPSSTK